MPLARSCTARRLARVATPSERAGGRRRIGVVSSLEASRVVDGLRQPPPTRPAGECFAATTRPTGLPSRGSRGNAAPPCTRSTVRARRRRDRRRTTGPRRRRERRAALDSWERELERGLATGRSDHPVIAALVHAGVDVRPPARRAPVRTWRRCGWTATGCGSETRDELERLHGGQRRLGRPDHGRDPRRSGRDRAPRAAGNRVPADESSPRRSRGLRARPDLPARRRARAPRRRRRRSRRRIPRRPRFDG